MIMSVTAGVIAYESSRLLCCTWLPDVLSSGASTKVYQLGTFALSLLLV